MKNILEHIEHARSKPHHIRKRITVAVATGGAGLVALIWLVGSFSTNSFALQGNSFADSTGQGSALVATGNTNSADSGFAGVASAIPGAGEPAHIEIINTTPTSTQNTSEQTTIPF